MDEAASVTVHTELGSEVASSSRGPENINIDRASVTDAAVQHHKNRRRGRGKAKKSANGNDGNDPIDEPLKQPLNESVDAEPPIEKSVHTKPSSSIDEDDRGAIKTKKNVPRSKDGEPASKQVSLAQKAVEQIDHKGGNMDEGDEEEVDAHHAQSHHHQNEKRRRKRRHHHNHPKHEEDEDEHLHKSVFTKVAEGQVDMFIQKGFSQACWSLGIVLPHHVAANQDSLGGGNAGSESPIMSSTNTFSNELLLGTQP